MPRRMAVAVALVAFAVCMLCGLLADNTFAETVKRGLLAMATTGAVGLAVGAMAGRMVRESVEGSSKKPPVSEAKPAAEDR